MPAVFIRLLLDSYLNQRICAAWGACKSDFFQATDGVKQGSIISPILFTVYVDELIARLQASGLGCNIGRSYIGVLGYADDLTLLSPSVNALSKIYARNMPRNMTYCLIVRKQLVYILVIGAITV